MLTLKETDVAIAAADIYPPRTIRTSWAVIDGNSTTMLGYAIEQKRTVDNPSLIKL